MTPSNPSPVETSAAAWEDRARELTARLRNTQGEPDLAALFELADLLPAEDGKPMETPWHRAAMNLLIEVLNHHWRGRDDFYAGGNMFVYYFERKKDIPQSKGPDFFVALGVDRDTPRDKWVVFTEGKFPQV